MRKQDYGGGDRKQKDYGGRYLDRTHKRQWNGNSHDSSKASTDASGSCGGRTDMDTSSCGGRTGMDTSSCDSRTDMDASGSCGGRTDMDASDSAGKRRLEHWQVIAAFLMTYDIVAINLAYFLALWIRFDCRYSEIPPVYLHTFLKFAPLYTIVCVIVFWRLRLYKSIWKFASYSELARVTAANVITAMLHIAGITLMMNLDRIKGYGRMPISYHVIGILSQVVLTLGIRFSYRFLLLQRRSREKVSGGDTPASRVMLIGAGSAGRMILRDLNIAKETNERVCCIIDDDSNKWNRFIDGVIVAGGREMILKAVEDYKIQKIFVALPSATPEERRDILNICKETGCELKNMPGIYQFVTGEVTASVMRDVAVEDLLGRDLVKVDLGEIFQYLQGKTILVTGGGGSIGSELCRQIAGHNPRQLIIFDVYENNAYAIEQELKKTFPKLNLVVLIGSVRDSRKISQVFETYRPDVVYHAAAHKHVPLMETSPCEAIKNNTIGTYKTAYAAMANGCQRFVLISTDKAVNPTNIMGASKRLCEMVIQSFDYMIKAGKSREMPVLHAHMWDEVGSMEDSLGAQEGRKENGLGAQEGRIENGLGAQERRKEDGSRVQDGSIEDGFCVQDRRMEDGVNVENGNMQNGSSVQDGWNSQSAKPSLLHPKTEFVAVRFGNVLGSNGSVIPLFKKQIEAGGPVTVTHPDIIRYFMTIPEAVSLVLQAGIYARGGEIFVLDMGSPMKIDTLARNLIKLSGYKPDVDIQVEYTGLRPGEKLYEEKLMAEEGMKTTPNQLIHIGSPIAFDVERFLGQLRELMLVSYENDGKAIHRLVGEMVTTYHHAGENGSEAKGEVYEELMSGVNRANVSNAS